MTEIFERDCPYYMALGMTYEQYWYGDVHMARAFYKADRIRQRRMNDEAWLYGAYVCKAIEATICNAFRKSGTPPAEYPKEPVWRDEPDEYEVEQEQMKREEQEALYAEAYMTNMFLAGQNWGKTK